MAQKMKGQVGIWVLVGLGVLALFGLFLLLQRGPTVDVFQQDDVSAYITSCARTATREIVEQQLPRGGLVTGTPSFPYKNVSRLYLCYHRGYFEPCRMQHPFLLEETRQEMLAFITPRIRECFDQLKTTQEARGKEMSMQELVVNVSIVPETIVLQIERAVVVRSKGQTQQFHDFSTTLRSPLFDVLDIAREISNQEAQYCYFEYAGYSILYPRFQIDKTTLGEGTKVYTITERASKNQFVFGTRGCAIPPGV